MSANSTKSIKAKKEAILTVLRLLDALKLTPQQLVDAEAIIKIAEYKTEADYSQGESSPLFTSLIDDYLVYKAESAKEETPDEYERLVGMAKILGWLK